MLKFLFPLLTPPCQRTVSVEKKHVENHQGTNGGDRMIEDIFLSLLGVLPTHFRLHRLALHTKKNPFWSHCGQVKEEPPHQRKVNTWAGSSPGNILESFANLY